jgi:TetR/AcrR family transcriptional repressor of mexJK operon
MRKRSDDTKKNIISNAKSLFLENGYKSTTLDQIANKSNKTKRTIYGYFKNKEDILNEVIKMTVGVPWVFAFPIDNITSSEDLYYILYTIIKGVNEAYSSTEYVQLIRMVIAEVNAHPEMYNMLSNGITNRSLAVVVQTLTAADKAGIVSIPNPKFSAQALIGGLLTNFYSGGLLAPHPAILRKYNQDELMAYIATCMPTLINNVIEHAA